MRKLGCHFHKHGHHGPALTRCRKLQKWSRGMECSKKAQSANEMHASSHSSCTGHHDHHSNEHHKWCSWNMRRKFHHFQHGHKKHHIHNHRHHHPCHGQHQRCSHQNGDNQSKRHEVHVPECCCSFESQSKACQTDLVSEETQETNHSVGAETVEVQQSSC